MHRKTAIAIGAVIALGLAPAMSAERVAFDRSQLDDPAYVAALYSQIKVAAKRECAKTISSTLYYQQRFADCVDESVEAAIAEIDAPALTALAAAD